MSVNVRLESIGGQKLSTLKIIREILGIGMKEAMALVENVPCTVANDISVEEAERLVGALENVGAYAVIEQEETTTVFPDFITESFPENNAPSKQVAANNASYVVDHSNDRATLIQLWHDYTMRDKTEKLLKKEIDEKRGLMASLDKTAKEMRKEIETNKKVVDTSGECLRPKEYTASVFSYLEFPPFEILKVAFIALTVVSFVIFLILVAVAPTLIENLSTKINVSPGALVWLGSPVVGAALTVVGIIIYLVYQVFENINYKKRKAQECATFDPYAASRKAVEFMNNIEEHTSRLSDVENRIEKTASELNESKAKLASLPKVVSPIAIPNELRTADGVALLLHYIQSGRADNAKEAIIIYDRDMREQMQLAEIKKATEYARQQAEAAYIAAINTEKMREEAERAADAAERTASAATFSAISNAFGAASAQQAANAAARTANAAEETAYYAKRA